MTNINILQHIRIDLNKDTDYLLERHCRINYACDCPWAREIGYEEYRANWFANSGQQEEFLSALRNSMKDERTIAEIIKLIPRQKFARQTFATPLKRGIETPSFTNDLIGVSIAEQGETVGFIWVPFHGRDASFIWADVQDLYVEEPFRGSGIASYLMEYAEKHARDNGAKVIRSGTGCENIASQKMHGKLGYYQYRMEYEKVLG